MAASLLGHNPEHELQNGISILSKSKGGDSVFDQIKKGESFVYGERGRKSAWYMAGDAHGTQMASLIAAMDPLCEIFIAQVGEGRHDITPERVEKVGNL